MNVSLDRTHDPALRSWVESANDENSDFPIQNLPFGRFRRDPHEPWAIGVAIGDKVLDLRKAGIIATSNMNELMSLDRLAHRKLRRLLSTGLTEGSPMQEAWSPALAHRSSVEMGLPCEIGDYTDFYVGIHHATAVGRLFRPENPLLPNYKWVPIGYHGRASTIAPSGQGFLRPSGQIKEPGDDAPTLGQTRRLDFELELGIFVGVPNAQGCPIPLASSEEHIFGLAVFNDWSARDFQAWEYQPLGPFLSKNFASTVSPWIVTMEALAPFRTAFKRPDGDPEPLSYLKNLMNQKHGAIDIELEVRLLTALMRKARQRGEVISTSNFAEAAYWTAGQLIAHHTVNGCALRAGDLLGTGTLSGPHPSQAGSLLELTEGGKKTLKLSNGEERLFLQDGDTIEITARCRSDGFRSIGFGACTGTVLAAEQGALSHSSRPHGADVC